MATSAYANFGSDVKETLLLWQIIRNGGDLNTQSQINPLLMRELFASGDSATDDDQIQQMLLLHSFQNPDMQNWLPFVLQSSKGISDKLIMMQYMQQMERQGLSAQSELFPLMMLNDERHCTIGGEVCNCEKSRSETILKIMLLTGGTFLGNSPQSNLFYLLFNDQDGCTCTTDAGAEGTCSDEDVQGIDPMMMYFIMNSIPGQFTSQIMPNKPPARSVDTTTLLMGMSGLPQEYSWLMHVDGAERKELIKLQLYKTMGVPPAMIELFNAQRTGAAMTPSDKFNMLQWMNMGQGNPEMSPEMTALMIASDDEQKADAKKFFISAQLSAGTIPEITGILLMALAEGADPSDIKNVLVQVAAGQLNPEAFSIISKPYVPELPEGIYPGQDLYFVHLHLLGQDTCAMHDLRNRFPCQRNQFGGRGPLNAEQCEISPYCCWNPVQILDSDLQQMEGFGPTDSATNIPWCYYNVFFVFHDTYSLRVARPVKVQNVNNDNDPSNDIDDSFWNTAFAPLAECPGLFKYGLQLNPVIYARAVQNTDSDPRLLQLVNKREECGFPGILEFQCVAIRGCCWDNTPVTNPNYNWRQAANYKIPQCYKPIKLIPASVFQIMQPPKELKASPGECNTNFFKVPQLYYEREACNYEIEMYKYGSSYDTKTPLDQPTPEDCLYKLGCCWEDDQSVLDTYRWIPQCYKRQRDLDTGIETKIPFKITVDKLVARSGQF
jgi:hypothetical protein